MIMRTYIHSLVTKLLSSVALVVMAFGCAARHDEDRGYTLDSVCEKIARDYCRNIEPCCKSSGLGYSRKGCEGHSRAACEDQVKNVKAGRATFDVHAAEACVAMSAITETCRLETEVELAEWAERNEICDSIFNRVRLCDSDRDCVRSLTRYERCEFGECVEAFTLVGEDEQCSVLRGTECKEGYYCHRYSRQHVEGVCKVPSQIGEECGGARECDSEAYCYEEEGKCALKKSVGRPCGSDAECRLGNCVGRRCAAVDLVSEMVCSGR